MSEELSRFRLVLVGPRTPGNVGACARVAANFGCRDWVIVAPQCRWDDWDAKKLATGIAREFLDGARVLESVEEAVQDCEAAVGFSRRQGKERRQTLSMSELAEIGSRGGPSGKIALVFGNEETGLSQEELKPCTLLCTIPTSDELGSMNLSHAVAVVLARVYEESATAPVALRKARQAPSAAVLGELDGMMGHWGEFLADIGLITAGNPERMVTMLRRIFTRAHLSGREIRALRGLLFKAQVKLGVRKRGQRIEER
jgi:TrmH family RNA methyltransferase